MIRTLAAALLMLATPAFAQSAPAPDINDADAAQIQLALDRGTLLYWYDQAAWHGTDDMLTKLDDSAKATIGGWIVDGPAGSPDLIFYDKDAADPHAVYVAHFEVDKLVSSHVLGPNDDRSLSPTRKRMIAALASARAALAAANVNMCADKPFNTVVLPPEHEGGPTLVYFLTPQTENGVLPFGGHYRFEISVDGKAGPVHAFTRACMSVPTQNAKGGEKTVALMVTQLIGNVPTEIHVFSMMAANQPIFVGTPDNRMWAVELNHGQAQVSLVDRKGTK